MYLQIFNVKKMMYEYYFMNIDTKAMFRFITINMVEKDNGKAGEKSWHLYPMTRTRNIYHHMLNSN